MPLQSSESQIDCLIMEKNEMTLFVQIEDFVKDIEDESKSFCCGNFNPPKVLADIVESIAYAVFLTVCIL